MRGISIRRNQEVEETIRARGAGSEHGVADVLSIGRSHHGPVSGESTRRFALIEIDRRYSVRRERIGHHRPCSCPVIEQRAVRRDIGQAVRRALAGGLPNRYHQAWEADFKRLIEPSLVSGARILDVGSGRRPAIEPARRPPGCYYVGLDASANELRTAPPGSYDDIIIRDLTEPARDVLSFDLVVSWQVLEHVKSLDDAVAAIHAYLRPGGRLVALLSGRFSLFGLINRLIPADVGHRLVSLVMRRELETVFDAHYDACYHTALTRTFTDWTSALIIPRFNGAGYLSFSRLLQAVYIAYEEWSYSGAHRNLATHYLIDAVR